MQLNYTGEELHQFAQKIFPIHRSITGRGVEKTLELIQEVLPELAIKKVSSGTKAFDWTVPPEWNIADAYIIDPNGKKRLSFKDSNLHVVSYSEPINRKMNLSELKEHLYSLPGNPHAIPYVTSYYARRWGFCLTDHELQSLPDGEYEVVIDSEFNEQGNLTYGELVIPGESSDEVLLSTYICHPSLANNETSGPVVTSFIAHWLNSLSKRKYTYRIVFVPETIGSITYLSKNIDHLKTYTKAGFVLTCIGDERHYSVLTSRAENTIADFAALEAVFEIDPNFKRFSFLERGSDERQYCAPGVDLPIASLMRSRYVDYPEYHTSKDDLENVVTPKGLAGGFNLAQKTIEKLESPMFDEMIYPKVSVMCEPQMGKRGLYPTLGAKISPSYVNDMMNLIAYSDGSKSFYEICLKINKSAKEMKPVLDKLHEEGVLEFINSQ